VAASVFDRYRVPLYKQAGFKRYIIAGMMLTNRFSNPADALAQLMAKDHKRVF
jgi:hypothetical protein